MNKLVFKFLFVFVCLNPVLIHAQLRNDLHSQYTFQTLTVDDGIGNNRVRGLGQDTLGYIWIGTPTGLYRYDGYDVTPYETFLSDTAVSEFKETRDIFSDSKGNLWAVGIYGICKFDFINNKFNRLYDPENEKAFVKSNGIGEDSKGNLWISLENCFVSYNQEENTFTYFDEDTRPELPVKGGKPTRLLVDHDDNVFVAYNKKGLLIYNIKNDKFAWYEADGTDGALGENLIEKFYEDPKGNIWIGYNNNGFSKYHRDANYFETIFLDSTNKQSGRVRGLQKDLLGNFWIGTQGGLYLYNERTGEAYLYADSKHPISRISHNSIQNIYLDDKENLWLGTYAGGVNYTSLITTGFIKYSYTPFESPYYLNDKNVYAIAIDPDNNLWLGTENGGINYLNRKTGKFTYFVHDPDNPNSPLSNNIKDIEFDTKGNFWFASYNGGLSYYNRETGIFKHTLQTKENPDGFPEKRVYTLLLDPSDEDILYIGCRYGLYIYHISSGEYQKVEPGMEGYNNVPELNNQIQDIINYKNERIYFATDKLVYLDLNTKTFKSVNEFNGQGVNNTDFVFSDKNGNIWFNFRDNSLIRSDSEFENYIVFDKKKGIPDAMLIAVTEDDDDNLWVSSNQGIIKLANIIANPDSFSVRVYNKSDNLQSQEFLYHSVAKSSLGEIYFGGINGFNSFYPYMIADNPYPPTILITGIKVDNEMVKVGEKVHGRVLLKTAIQNQEQIKIHPRVQGFSLEFTGLHFGASEQNYFKYILEGFDKDWTVTSADIRFANYSNLPPGKYTFKVIAANYSGVWCESPAHISIKVIRPIYRKWWFLLLVISGIILGVRYLINLRENQLRKDKKDLEKKISEAERNLRVQKDEVENQKRELEQKAESEKIGKWHNEGIKLFSDILSNRKDDIEILGSELMSNCVTYLDAQQGAIFILNDSDKDNPYLELSASYAFNTEGKERKVFYPGEGLVGMCFKEKEIIQNNNLPDNYAVLSSGLGEVKLTHLLLIPLRREDIVLGVMELASTEKIEDYKIKLLETISENIVSVLFSLRSNQTISKMLRDAQEQGEMLKAQEEEMIQTMEEMQANQEESSQREERLLKELEELKEQLNKNK